MSKHQLLHEEQQRRAGPHRFLHCLIDGCAYRIYYLPSDVTASQKLTLVTLPQLNAVSDEVSFQSILVLLELNSFSSPTTESHPLLLDTPFIEKILFLLCPPQRAHCNTASGPVLNT